MNHKSHPSQNSFLFSLILRFGRFSTDSFIAIRGLRSIFSAAVSADRPHGRHISSSASGTVFIRPDLPNHHSMDRMMIYLFWYNPSRDLSGSLWWVYITAVDVVLSVRISIWHPAGLLCIHTCHPAMVQLIIGRIVLKPIFFRTLWVWYTLIPFLEHLWCVWFHCRDIFTCFCPSITTIFQ